jgi:hypothetical protein
MCAASPEESLRELANVVHSPLDTVIAVAAVAAVTTPAVEEAETRRRCWTPAAAAGAAHPARAREAAVVKQESACDGMVNREQRPPPGEK